MREAGYDVDVRWAELGASKGRAPAGQRPVLVIGHDVFNEGLNEIIA